MARQKCRHCRAKYANRPRGLCWSCFYRPGVRDLYSVDACRQNNRGSSSDFNGKAPIPPPTTALPATDEKIEVMAKRVVAGNSLWSPDDSERATE